MPPLSLPRQGQAGTEVCCGQRESRLLSPFLAPAGPTGKFRVQAGGQIGGKGSVRRKKTAVHKTSTLDDKKLQTTLKRLQVNPIPNIEEVC